MFDLDRKVRVFETVLAPLSKVKMIDVQLSHPLLSIIVPKLHQNHDAITVDLKMTLPKEQILTLSDLTLFIDVFHLQIVVVALLGHLDLLEIVDFQCQFH